MLLVYYYLIFMWKSIIQHPLLDHYVTYIWIIVTQSDKTFIKGNCLQFILIIWLFYFLFISVLEDIAQGSQDSFHNFLLERT